MVDSDTVCVIGAVVRHYEDCDVTLVSLVVDTVDELADYVFLVTCADKDSVALKVSLAKLVVSVCLCILHSSLVSVLEPK